MSQTEQDEARRDATVDMIGVLVIVLTLLAGAVHFVSGWTFDL